MLLDKMRWPQIQKLQWGQLPIMQQKSVTPENLGRTECPHDFEQ